jgi:transcriptional regulator with XRE-family HTH domain
VDCQSLPTEADPTKPKGQKEKQLLAKNVRHLRRELGMSQEDLAFAAHIDRTYASQVERGVCNPSLEVLLALAKALNVKIIDLFKGL